MPQRKPTTSRIKSVRINPLLYAIACLLAILYVVVGLPLRQAHRKWQQQRVGEATAGLTEWSRLHLRPAEYDEALAVVLLTAGKAKEAQPYLDRVSSRPADWFPTFAKSEVAEVLVGKGRYDEFIRYDRAVRHRREGSEVGLYRVAALLGLNRLSEAASAFAALDAGSVDKPRYDQLRRALDERRSGRFPVIFDRTGKSLADYHVQNADLFVVNQDFAPLLEKSAGALTLENRLSEIGTTNSIDTTLDPFVQKAALAALGNLRGSLVAIDPATNEILAIASSHPYGPMRNLALEGAYEPGSVIKVLTALKAVSAGVDLSKVFPMVCRGLLKVDGRQYMDWAVHGDLADLNDALAVSCNTAFADMGLRVGREGLLQFLRSVGFDQQLDLGLVRVPLGKTTGSFYNKFEVANLAVGLEHETINALHLATLASMVANRGRWVAPRLVRGRRSILGEPVGTVPPQTASQVVPEETANRVIQAMQAVVTNPRGTGRRVAISGLSVAMKTGTAGQAEGGYNSLIMAFAPADRPRIALGMISENSGHADLLGARVAHDFLEAMQPRLK